jgi:hypothetical protein
MSKDTRNGLNKKEQGDDECALQFEIPINDRKHLNTPSLGGSEPCSTIIKTLKPKKDFVHTPDQIIYLRTGFCKHESLSEFQIPHTDIVIIQCCICNKEMERYYA